MNVRVKLLIIVTFVALVPTSFLAYTTLSLHQAALDEKISELHVRSARYGAKIVETNLERAVLGLEATIEDSIRWAELTPHEVEGALWLVRGQLASIVSVALLDASGKQVLARAQSEEVARPGAAVPDSPRNLQLLAAALPPRAAPGQNFLHGDPLLLEDGATRVLPVGFHVNSETGRSIVLVGVALDAVCNEIARESPEHASMLWLDPSGRQMCGATRADDAGAVAPGLLAGLSQGQLAGIRYMRTDRTPMLAAAAVTPWGFHVVVAQPVADAFAPSARMRVESLLWIAIGVVAALVAGLFLARSISIPLARLAGGAEQVARGEFAVRLPVEGKDELAGVAASFNRMCTEIEAREREIRGWNEELRARVEAQTSELKEAQHALLESRKIAAMATLAAGVAHEINNPLTGIIGLTQVLIARAASRGQETAETKMLVSVEREALRVRDIVAKLLRMSQAQEVGGQRQLQASDLLREVVMARVESLEQAGITLAQTFGPDIPNVLADREQLSHALEEIVDNAVKAMRGRKGELSVSVEAIGSELVKLRVVDNGRGIAPEHLDKVFEPFFTTKNDWHGQGLGLTAAHQVIEAHHGTIKLESRLGHGTAVTVVLPATRPGAHLQ